MIRKLVVLVALAAIAPLPARAASTWDVAVQDFEFSPGTIVVAHGDTVRWDWVSGQHSVENDANGATVCEARTAPSTCTLTVPDGAPFVLRYHCGIHGPIMSGVITTDPPPTVSFTSPADGGITLTPASMSGVASDDSAVASIRVTWQSTPVALFTGSADAVCAGCGTPSATWTLSQILAPGRYILRATATDDLGLETSSRPITVTVV